MKEDNQNSNMEEHLAKEAVPKEGVCYLNGRQYAEEALSKIEWMNCLSVRLTWKADCVDWE